MHEIFGHTAPDEALDTELTAAAQALVDRFLTAAHQTIAASEALKMDEVDMGGSALCAALHALLCTTQAEALPDTSAVAFSIGVAFGGYFATEGAAEDLADTMEAIGAGVATGMTVRASPASNAQTFGRA